jgi:hypothetical protein
MAERESLEHSFFRGRISSPNAEKISINHDVRVLRCLSPFT